MKKTILALLSTLILLCASHTLPQDTRNVQVKHKADSLIITRPSTKNASCLSGFGSAVIAGVVMAGLECAAEQWYGNPIHTISFWLLKLQVRYLHQHSTIDCTRVTFT